MTEKLEIQDGVVNSQSTSAFTRVSQRIEFSWKKTEYDGILEAIKEGVSSLERLASSAIAEEPTRKLSGRRRSINILREISGSVYRALKSNLRCGIECSHEVHLGLEAPSNFAYGEDDEAAIDHRKAVVLVGYDLQSRRRYSKHGIWSVTETLLGGNWHPSNST
ncbi:hypothetical protein CGMCC3_g12141 [Colletotrichum fructicola]|nr:uncharacterized protein CGMCC3_g12141 [Colletotrichum fructicola]KAE9571730.1 hypothetical protein CGMCC3_g12141 [Colletotrichum fructicola]